MKSRLLSKLLSLKTKQATTSPLNTEFSLEDLAYYWTINGVQYRNGIYQVDLLKTLLDNKAKKTQDEWVEYSKKAIAKNEFYVGDFPLYHALFTALFKNKDDSRYKDNINKVKEFISKNMFDYWLTTLTRIRYKAQGKDEVIHNYKMQDQYEIQENIIGGDGYITQINPQNELNAILGSNNISLINNVYKWITGSEVYLLRVNSKPREDDEYVAGFNAYSNGAYLYCDRIPEGSDRALGVRAQNFDSILKQIANEVGIINPIEIKKGLEFYKKAKELELIR